MLGEYRNCLKSACRRKVGGGAAYSCTPCAMADSTGHEITAQQGCDQRAAERGECDEYEAVVLAQIPSVAATPRRTLAGMSFSFTASGTKAQTLVTLGTVAAGHDPAAATIADLLALMVTAGPDESSDGKPVPYEATAFGHSARSLSRDN